MHLCVCMSCSRTVETSSATMHWTHRSFITTHAFFSFLYIRGTSVSASCAYSYADLSGPLLKAKRCCSLVQSSSIDVYVYGKIEYVRIVRILQIGMIEYICSSSGPIAFFIVCSSSRRRLGVKSVYTDTFSVANHQYALSRGGWAIQLYRVVQKKLHKV